jgi:hypothetical protein
VAELQESVVQLLLSLQFLAVPVQTPFLHASLTVQALLSLQGRVLGVYTQPVGRTGTHVSVVQGLLSLQTLAGPGTQTPFAHVSFTVQ